MELSVTFESLEDWLAFRGENEALFQPDQIDALGQYIKVNGLVEPLTGAQVAGHDVDPGPNWREGLSYGGCNARTRAVMRIIELILEENGWYQPRIFAAEAVTPFALRLRGLYPHFIGSEFTLDPVRREALYPIPHEDLQNLSLRSAAFDIVSTNEVLEHVPSIDDALREIARVLRPGGWHVGTVPFAWMDQHSLRRATIEKGRIVHLMEPEYHGDPMNEGGVLVFETPGWEILQRARDAGFSRAEMRFIISQQYGIVSDHAAGVFVLCMQR